MWNIVEPDDQAFYLALVSDEPTCDNINSECSAQDNARYTVLCNNALLLTPFFVEQPTEQMKQLNCHCYSDRHHT